MPNSIITDEVSYSYGQTSVTNRECHWWNDSCKVVITGGPHSYMALPNASKPKLVLNIHNEGRPVDAQLWRIRSGRCRILLQTKGGPIALSLPRDFQGFLYIRTPHEIRLASGVQSRATLLSQRDNVGCYFVGNQSQEQAAAGDQWSGDDVTVITDRGEVEIAFARRLAYLRQL